MFPYQPKKVKSGEILSEASQLKDLQIPKHYAEKKEMREFSMLHVFDDVSPLAYVAAAKIGTS